MEKLKKNRFVALVLTICLLVASSSISITVYAATHPSFTTTIETGSMIDTASYVIFKDGSTYFAKNGTTGTIDFSGTNTSELIENCINALPHVSVSLPIPDNPTISASHGSLFFTKARYILPKRIHIPLGSRIKLFGEGITFQPSASGELGGTQFVSNDDHGILIAEDYGKLENGTDVTSKSGTELVIEDIEFVQNVAFADASQKALLLNGASQGILRNIVVTSYKVGGDILDGGGISIDCWQYGGYWRWDRVQVYGFKNAIQDYTNHLSATNIGIGACEQALIVWVNPNHHYSDLHIFAPKNIITVTGGDDNLYINGLYVEGYTNDEAYYAYWANDTMFKGQVIIEKCAIHTCEDEAWTFYTSERFRFQDVMTRTTSPEFPATDTPTLASATNFTNTNPEMVEIYLQGGAISSILINGGSINTTVPVSFILFPNDVVNVTYTGSPTWVWRGLANARHIS